MRYSHVLTFTLIVGALALAGCGGGGEQAPDASAETASSQSDLVPLPGEGGEMPPDHPPMGGSATGIAAPPAGSGTGDTGLEWTAPDSWVSETPSSRMRRAQYRVPGEAGDGECVVFYFGPGQGGEKMANAQRWARMFSQPDGGDPLEVLETESEVVNGRDVLWVSTTGRYQNTMTDDPAIEDAKLEAAIVEGPDANWFFKLTGPRETVESQEQAFEAMVRSIDAAD